MHARRPLAAGGWPMVAEPLAGRSQFLLVALVVACCCTSATAQYSDLAPWEAPAVHKSTPKATPKAASSVRAGLVLARVANVANTTTAWRPTPEALNASNYPYESLTQSNPRELGQWTYVGYAGIAGSAVAMVANSPYLLMVEFITNSWHPDGRRINTPNIGFFNLNTNTYEPVPGIYPHLACGAYAPSPNGSITLWGGHSAAGQHARALNHLHELVTDSTGKPQSVRLMGYMFLNRWYPTTVPLADGRLLVVAGANSLWGEICNSQATNEVYDPVTGNRTQHFFPYPFEFEAWKNTTKKSRRTGGCYPPSFMLPITGHVIVFDYKGTVVIDPYTSKILLVLPPHPKPDGLDWTFVFPFYAPVTMLGVQVPPKNQGPVNATFVIQGGNVRHARPLTEAANFSLRLTITVLRELPATRSGVSPASSQYIVHNWEVEKMLHKRVMGDAVLLPNNQIVLLNGARAGFGEVNPFSNFPVLTPELYTPWSPPGKRYTALQRTTIPRLYHSVGYLTPRGDVVVMGCSSCNRSWYQHDGPPISPSPWGIPEYRVERFLPPALTNPRGRPRLLDCPQSLKYNELFFVNVSAPTKITRVAMVNPGSVTHGVHMGKTLVFLRLINGGRTAIKARAPPDPTFAAPAWYLLFAMYGETYSPGCWVQLGGEVQPELRRKAAAGRR